MELYFVLERTQMELTDELGFIMEESVEGMPLMGAVEMLPADDGGTDVTLKLSYFLPGALPWPASSLAPPLDPASLCCHCSAVAWNPPPSVRTAAVGLCTAFSTGLGAATRATGGTTCRLAMRCSLVPGGGGQCTIQQMRAARPKR
jgi:hypothetical protein